ncbi:hypothetical protein BU16DRAFT_578416 [Lophium mytilinum]|uniref:Uncharacterized protein n=1 Tax=Lophium mytilinum TaxID=390894 RepID=A0A6A6R7M0_9PEZI|nr:hypothetical protein BU16DRAFT_578416 [Lophium mytilinum]
MSCYRRDWPTDSVQARSAPLPVATSTPTTTSTTSKDDKQSDPTPTTVTTSTLLRGPLRAPWTLAESASLDHTAPLPKSQNRRAYTFTDDSATSIYGGIIPCSFRQSVNSSQSRSFSKPQLPPPYSQRPDLSPVTSSQSMFPTNSSHFSYCRIYSRHGPTCPHEVHHDLFDTAGLPLDHIYDEVTWDNREFSVTAPHSSKSRSANHSMRVVDDAIDIGDKVERARSAATIRSTKVQDSVGIPWYVLERTQSGLICASEIPAPPWDRSIVEKMVNGRANVDPMGW